MKRINPLILVAAAMTSAIATAILSANNVFKGQTWLAWCLYGITLFLLAWAGINAAFSSRREQEKDLPPSPPPPVPQNYSQSIKQEFNPQFNPSIQIGFDTKATDQERQENLIYDFMRQNHSQTAYNLAEIVNGTGLTERQAWDALQRLKNRKQVHQIEGIGVERSWIVVGY